LDDGADMLDIDLSLELLEFLFEDRRDFFGFDGHGRSLRVSFA
jgi:hypothetical protein